MPTPLELAQQAENRKLRMAGLNPDGTPIDNPDSSGDPDDNPDSSGDLDDNRDNGGDLDDTPNLDDTSGSDSSDLAARLQQMEQNFASLHNRVAPLQRQNEEFRDLWNAERRTREQEREQYEHQLAELREQLEARSEPELNVEEVLTPEELADLDPTVLQAMKKLVTTAAKKLAPKQSNVTAEVQRLLRERDAERVTQHRRSVLTDPKRGIHKLGELAYDPKFADWAKETGLESVVASLMSAQSTEEVDRHARIIANRLTEWGKTKGKAQPSDPRTSLGSQMRRRPQAKLSQQELDAKLNEVKRLSRSRDPKERARADQLLRELESY